MPDGGYLPSRGSQLDLLYMSAHTSMEGDVSKPFKSIYPTGSSSSSGSNVVTFNSHQANTSHCIGGHCPERIVPRKVGLAFHYRWVLQHVK